ncbi:hypothetical protein [Kribbella ginsengisoli]|uniref:hypothetical protein n=1 Tax=Kribbella ginsengisoli TaxID=363865 RepID=UPI0031D9F080
MRFWFRLARSACADVNSPIVEHITSDQMTSTRVGTGVVVGALDGCGAAPFSSAGLEHPVSTSSSPSTATR